MYLFFSFWLSVLIARSIHVAAKKWFLITECKYIIALYFYLGSVQIFFCYHVMLFLVILLRSPLRESGLQWVWTRQWRQESLSLGTDLTHLLTVGNLSYLLLQVLGGGSGQPQEQPSLLSWDSGDHHWGTNRSHPYVSTQMLRGAVSNQNL